MKSWRKTLPIMLAGLALSFLLFVAFSLGYVYRQNRGMIEKDRAAAADLWTGQLESQLKGAENQILQMTISIYNNLEIRHKSPAMKAEQQNTYITMMDEMLQANKALTYCFIVDTDTTNLLIRAQNGEVTGLQTLEVKTYLRTADLPLSSIADKTWHAVRINDNVYMNHNILMGKYIIGALVHSENFDFLPDPDETEPVMNFYVHSGDKLLLLSGTGDLEMNTEARDNNYWNHYQITAIPAEQLDGEVVMLAEQIGLLDLLSDISLFLVILGLWIVFFLMLIVFRLNRMISRPTQTVLEAIEGFGQGNIGYRIEGDAGSSEFETVYSAFNEMADQIENLKIEAYENKVREQSEELSRLRAQIMPHFCLNAINTVANMTYAGDNEGIRSYIGALAKYVRYMMNLKDRTVTLGQELDHIRNYLEMQKIRFPNSVDFFILCPEQLRNRDIPYLLVFTLVENTIKHAMDLYSTLEILISCEEYKTENFKGTRLVVEDNGPGFTEEVMATYQDPNRLPKVKEHIGLSNVIRTLTLTYHRSDLLRLSNSVTGGAHVELLIPDPALEEPDTEPGTEKQEQTEKGGAVR